MLLKQIHLKNFISHKDTDIRFEKGLTVITGPNGSGKTSILDGILFCLFKESRAGEKTLRQLIHSTAKTAECSLTFEEKGMEYKVTWRLALKKNQVKTSAELVNLKTNETFESPEVVKSEIEKILGLRKESAIASIFVKQGEVDALVNLTPADRKETIGKLIGIEELEKVWQKFPELINNFEKKTESIDQILKNIEDLQSDISAIEENIQNFNVNIETLEKEYKVINTAFVDVVETLNKLEKIRDQYDNLNVQNELENNNLKNLQKTMEERKENLKNIENTKLKIQEMERDIQFLEIVREYISKDSDLKFIDLDLKNLRDQIETIEKQNLILNSTKEDCRKYLNNEDSLKKISAEIEALGYLEPTKAKAEAELEGLNEKISELETKVSETENKITQDIGIVKPEELITKADTFRSEIERLRKDLETEQSEIYSYTTKIEDLNKNKETVTTSKQCPVCRTELDETHRTRVAEEIDQEIAQLNENIKNQSIIRFQKNKELKENEALLDIIMNINIKYHIENKKLLDSLNMKRLEVLNRLSEISSNYENFGDLKKKKKDEEDANNELKDSYIKYTNAAAILERYSKEEIERNLNGRLKERESLEIKLNEIYQILNYKPDKKILKELESKDKNYNTLIGSIKEEPRLRLDLEKCDNEIALLKMKIKQIDEQLKSLNFNPDQLKQTKKNKEEYEHKLNELKTELSVYRSKLDSENKQKSKKVIELERLNLKEIEIEKRIRFIDALNNIRASFSKDGVQKILRFEFSNVIEERSRNYLDQFNLDIQDIKVDKDFNITIMTRGGEMAIAQLSGGEKVAVGVAVRLAIASALSEKISSITLDEPTTYLDEERRKDLVNILGYSLKISAQLVPQMIIVTHHQELADIADTHYEVSKKEGFSKVVLAELAE